MIDLLVNLLVPDHDAPPVYNTLLGLYFRLDDNVTWDSYSKCMEMCVALGSGDKEWFI